MLLAPLLLAASLPAGAQPGAWEQLQAMAPQEALDAAARFQAQATIPMAAAVQAAGIKDRYALKTALGAPLTKVPLDLALNRLWDSKTTFPAGDHTVHVFGVKAENNNGRSGWYVGFFVEGEPFIPGKNPLMVNGGKIAHFSFLTHRHREIMLNGLKFDVHIDIPLADHDPNAIKLTIQPRFQGQAKMAYTITQISAGVFETAYPVSIGGTEYRVVYTQDFLDNQGEFGGYTQDRSIALMFRDGNDYSGFHKFEHEIPTDDRIRVTTPQKVHPAGDSYEASAVTMGLRIEGRQLQFYYPIGPSVATQPIP